MSSRLRIDRHPYMPETSFQLYNTLSRSVETIEPIEAKHLRFYACGPTVYSYAHIGNFRSFLTADLILRTARAIGWETTYVTNITDVGHLTHDDVADASGQDRMEKALRSEEGRRFANIWDLARFYTDEMLHDWKALNLREPDVRPRATEHVAQQIQAIEQIIATGHGYETAKGVYFEVETFPDYGKLSGNTLDDELAHSVRDVVEDPEKRNPRDFALWKKDPHHLMLWYSPWGWGFPGWHIECSAMSQAYLGESFDLHTGGEDNKFPHHECEIAQAESITSKPFVRYWIHTRFLQVEGEKMSKSTGNFHTVRELIAREEDGGRGINPLALRLALISGQYRKPLNFTFDHLRASAKHVQRFEEAAQLVEQTRERRTNGKDQLGEWLDDTYERALAAMLDDLNTPGAIASALEGVRLIQGSGPNLNAASAESAHAWLTKINELLGIVWPDDHDRPRADDEADDPFAREVEQLLEEREQARRSRDFERADAIRDRLQEMDVEVMDSPDGTSWRRRVRV